MISYFGTSVVVNSKDSNSKDSNSKDEVGVETVAKYQFHQKAKFTRLVKLEMNQSWVQKLIISGGLWLQLIYHIYSIDYSYIPYQMIYLFYSNWDSKIASLLRAKDTGEL